MIMTLTERQQKVYRYYTSFYGKKYTLEEIGKMYDISAERIRQIIKRAKRRLCLPFRSKNIIRDYQNDFKELDENNREIQNLKSEIEDLQIINDYFSNKDYKDKNIELSNYVENKDKLANFKKENIINIQDLIQKYYNETRVSLKTIHLYELDFSSRTFNRLYLARINTLYDLINSTENEVMKIRNLGKNSYNEIIDKLSSMGLKLKKEGEEVNQSAVGYIDNDVYEKMKNYLKNKLEELEDIYNKKDEIEKRIVRYHKAVEQYLNNEDLFNSSYTIPAIKLDKEGVVKFET